MVPRTKAELRKMVSEITIEMYEEMTPQLIKLIDETKKDPTLTEAQKQDEISLHMMGYTKACTNEIIIEVLGEKPVELVWFYGLYLCVFIVLVQHIFSI